MGVRQAVCQEGKALGICGDVQSRTLNSDGRTKQQMKMSQERNNANIYDYLSNKEREN